MTLHELSQLYYLDKEIELDRERLAQLRSDLSSPRSPKYDGMPKGPNHENMLERCAVEIADLEAVIHAKIEKRMQERVKLELYIAEIPDSYTRQIFTLRFIDKLKWEEVADITGGSSYSVKHVCYRYISNG